MNTVRLALAGALMLALAVSAHAQTAPFFVSGYLADCSAVGSGTCTEFTSSGYARQPIAFNVPVRGAMPSAIPFTFGGAFAGTVAGRGVYDAPTGGNLLFSYPLANPVVAGSGNLDMGDVAKIRLMLTALVPYQFGDAYTGRVAATTAFGTTLEGTTVTSGVALSINRGVLQASATVPQGTE